MALRGVEGIPGSGKTYYVMHHILKNYYKWDEDRDCYVATVPGLRIITNIDGCKVGESLADLLRGCKGGVSEFFTYSYQKRFLGESRAIYVIDEAQNLFDRKFYNKDVAYFFQMHRHLGLDIYVITQDWFTLCREVQALCEFRVRAAPRVLRLGRGFRYHFVDSKGESFRVKLLRPDARVFAWYTSMSAEETEQISSVPLRYIGVAVGLLVLSGFVLFYYWIPAFQGKSKAAHAASSSRSSGSSRSSSLSGPGPVPDEGSGAVSVSSAVVVPEVRRLSVPGISVPDRGPAGVAPVPPPGAAPGRSAETGWVLLGWGKVTGTAGDLFIIEDWEGQRTVDRGEVERVFRKRPEGLVLGREYGVWVFTTDPDEARDYRERAAVKRGAATGANGSLGRVPPSDSGPVAVSAVVR